MTLLLYILSLMALAACTLAILNGRGGRWIPCVSFAAVLVVGGILVGADMGTPCGGRDGLEPPRLMEDLDPAPKFREERESVIKSMPKIFAGDFRAGDLVCIDGKIHMGVEDGTLISIHGKDGNGIGCEAVAGEGPLPVMDR